MVLQTHSYSERILSTCVHVFFVGLVDALVDAASDREEEAREAIFKSLVDIGRKKYSTVLETMHGYLTKHSKVSLKSRQVIPCCKLIRNTLYCL